MARKKCFQICSFSRSGAVMGKWMNKDTWLVFFVEILFGNFFK
jgi:hypothetical protein